MATKGRARALNRGDTTIIVPYESTPEKNIVKLETFELVNDTTLRLYFSMQLRNTATLLVPATYTVEGPMAITVSAVARDKQKRIDLTITGITVSGTYKVKVMNDIEGVNGIAIRNDVASREKEKYLTVQKPAVASATAASYSAINVLFSEDMLNDGALTTTTNYVITGSTALTVSLVTRLSATTVQLTVSTMLNLGSYIVTVSNVRDLVGNIIDPAHNAASFTGSAAAPQLSSATASDYNTVRLTFDTSMANNAALISTANYIFAGVTTLTASAVTRINATTVDVDTTEEMRNGGSYTVTVSNVTDLGGNVIDPIHAQTSFTGVGVLPQVASASAIDATHIDVVFDEAMTNNAALVATTNYVITGVATPATVGAVRQNATTVRIESIFVVPGAYTVTVSNVTDLVGNVIDPAHDAANFNIALTRPEVTSVANSTENALLMNFSENMSDTGLTTNGNYSVVGAAEYPFSNHPTLSDGLICYFEFNNNVTDATGNVTATAINSPTYVAGKWGTAINFDGSNQGVLLGNPAILQLEYITIATWVYIDAADTNSSICSKRGPTSHDWYWADNHFTTSIGGTNNDVHPLVDPRGSWKLLCKTFDGASEQLWVDGSPLVILDSSQWKRDILVGAPMTNLTSQTSVGYMTDAGYYLKAKMENFAIWNRRLTNQEMTDLYNSGSGLPY
jgi:hypothetical protein